MDDMYMDWLDDHRRFIIERCRELALSDDILDEINNVFRRAYEHPARFDADEVRDVIAYGLRERARFSSREHMG